MIIRIVCGVVACAGIAWGILIGPIVWNDKGVEDQARDLIQRRQYSLSTLIQATPELERIEQRGFCHPSAMRAAAIVRWRIANLSLDSGGVDVDAQFSKAEYALRQALSCAPIDSYLWFALFRARTMQNGLSDADFDLLRMSYQTGANEGWVAIARNRLAFTIFGRLPPDLAESALSEYDGIVRSGIYEEAISILTGPAWAWREPLLAHLEAVPLINRQVLSRGLIGLGYEIKIPGVESPEIRPWN